VEKKQKSSKFQTIHKIILLRSVFSSGIKFLHAFPYMIVIIVSPYGLALLFFDVLGHTVWISKILNGSNVLWGYLSGWMMGLAQGL
jgi:hypothetical protein